MQPASRGPRRRNASGPAVARLYHRLLAAIFLIAWVSLGVQVDVLIGSRGLLPAAPFLAAARAQGLGVAQLPTVFWLGAERLRRCAPASGSAPRSRPRRCSASGRASAPASPPRSTSATPPSCRTFLSFQWDNLLLECGALAVFLPTDRPARWIHVLFRVLLFKLYWESGIAKWQSYLGDWQDGSAMTFYYETAPLPAWPAWYAHHLPVWWHHLESWGGARARAACVPFLIFGPRRLKLRLLRACSPPSSSSTSPPANYGFFVYLALALHVFLLADRDVERLAARLPRRLPRAAARASARRASRGVGTRPCGVGGAAGRGRARRRRVDARARSRPSSPTPPAWQRLIVAAAGARTCPGA